MCMYQWAIIRMVKLLDDKSHAKNIIILKATGDCKETRNAIVHSMKTLALQLPT